MLGLGGINGKEILASIMMADGIATGGGNSEEFFVVGMSTTENKDESGRPMGFIHVTYKGIRIEESCSLGSKYYCNSIL